MCLLTLTLKFSTRTPKVPFGPLGGASGIAVFTARAPGGPRAPFFFSRGGSGAAPGGLGGASGAPLGRPGGVPGHLPATSGTLRVSLGAPRVRSRAPLGLPGRRWRGFGDLPRSVGSPRWVWSGRGLVSWAGFRCCVLT